MTDYTERQHKAQASLNKYLTSIHCRIEYDDNPPVKKEKKDKLVDNDARYTLTKLRQVRQARGYTQKELAFLAGIANCTVGSYERGESMATTLYAGKLAEVLKCKVEDLI